MTDQHIASGTKAGIIGGTLLNIAMSIDSSDLVRTAILATIGAVVSFTISILLKWMVRTVKRKRDPK